MDIIEREKTFQATQEEFILIGACLPRTGTLSLKSALGTLLKGRVAHGWDLYVDDSPATYDDAMQIYSKPPATDHAFRQWFLSRGYVAGVDAPFCLHIEQAVCAFPQAKVLLSMRDVKRWESSFRETVYRSEKMEDSAFYQAINRLWGIDVKPTPEKMRVLIKAFDLDQAESYYRDYHARIKALVPAKRLLEYSVTEGWEPLCRFLDVPIPNEPFPCVNDRQFFKDDIARQEREFKMRVGKTVLCLSILVCGIGCGVYYLRK